MYVSGWGTKHSGSLMRHKVALTIDFSQSAPRDGRWDFRVTLQFQRQDGENVFLDMDDDEALRLLREMEQFRRFRAEKLGVDHPEMEELLKQGDAAIQKGEMGPFDEQLLAE